MKSRHASSPGKIPTNRVDWSHPELEALLNKTIGWNLDNRGTHQPEQVEIQVGWQAGSSRPAVLVWKSENVMVLETAFALPHTEHVRVDCPFGDAIRSIWGIVVDGRPGNRAHDLENGIHVYWLKVSSNSR